jgi:protein Tex
VKAGQVVKVKVLSIDLARQRVALTMKLHPANNSGGAGARPGVPRPGQSGQQGQPARPGQGAGGGRPGASSASMPRDFGPKQDAAPTNPFAAQLAKLKLKGN